MSTVILSITMAVVRMYMHFERPNCCKENGDRVDQDLT